MIGGRVTWLAYHPHPRQTPDRRYTPAPVDRQTYVKTLPSRILLLIHIEKVLSSITFHFAELTQTLQLKISLITHTWEPQLLQNIVMINKSISEITTIVCYKQMSQWHEQRHAILHEYYTENNIQQWNVDPVIGSMSLLDQKWSKSKYYEHQTILK